MILQALTPVPAMTVAESIQSPDSGLRTLLPLSGILTKPALAPMLFLLACCCYVVYEVHLSPLANVPGPLLARFTNLWWLRVVLRRNVHLETIELHKRYGPLVRIGPNEVLLPFVSNLSKTY